MGLEVVLIGIIGILAGGVVNALADELPDHRKPALPTYPDGTSRPISAWLGITAFLFNQRKPPENDELISKDYVEKHPRRYKGHGKLTWRYPITEIVTAILMIATYLIMKDKPNVTTLQMVFWLTYMPIFTLIYVIDLEHKLILFAVMIPSAILTILDAVLTPIPVPPLRSALIGGVVSFVVFYIFYLGGFLFVYVMNQIRDRKINEVAFGYGDVMLIAFSGLMLGFENIVFVMFISVFLGSVGALVYLFGRLAVAGRYDWFTPIPYGPYIVTATIIVLLFSAEVRLALLGY